MRIDDIEAEAFVVPTDAPEADGTLDWNRTTLVVVHAVARDAIGIGYTYADASAASVARGVLRDAVLGTSAMDTPACFAAMVRAIRNQGRCGIAAMAISAVDVAIWDLKAKLLEVPLAALLGRARPSIPIYGSGGFTSYDDRALARQLEGWVQAGLERVKIKVGRDRARDLERVELARRVIGPHVELFVDANGAWDVRQALRMSEELSQFGVGWLEEPVSSDDLAGLRLLRERAPSAMDIAAGEYAWSEIDACRMLDADAVDVLQLDATRCGGVTGFMRCAALADARGVPISSHCAPALHVPLMCALARSRHLEWFHDHVRIEDLFFEGVPHPESGSLAPGSRPGLGIELRRAAASPPRAVAICDDSG